MILDKLLEFDPAGTAITSTAASTNVIDLHGANLVPAFSTTVKPGRDLGGGSASGPTPMLFVVITTTFTQAGATLNVQFQGAPDDGTGIPGTYATYAESGVLALANMAAGNVLLAIDVARIQPLPNTPALLPRFLRLNYVVASGPFTAGKLSAYISLSNEYSTAYLPGIAVAN